MRNWTRLNHEQRRRLWIRQTIRLKDKGPLPEPDGKVLIKRRRVSKGDAEEERGGREDNGFRKIEKEGGRIERKAVGKKDGRASKSSYKYKSNRPCSSNHPINQNITNLVSNKYTRSILKNEFTTVVKDKVNCRGCIKTEQIKEHIINCGEDDRVAGKGASSE